jgi:hypothetical protein
MRLVINFIALFSLCFISKAQMSVFQGMLLSKKDSTPIEYASIQIKKVGIGTLSNEVGKFSFHFADSLSKYPIEIASIGYKSVAINTTQIKAENADKEYVIFLEIDEILLSAIDIKEAKEVTLNIVTQAVNQIKSKYINKNHLLSGFYRELRIKDESFVHLVEADVDIQDYGFQTPTDRAKIRVNELRKSNFDGDRSFMEKMFRRMFDKKNSLINTYTSPMLRNYISMQNNETNVTTKKFLSWFEFRLKDFSVFEGTPVYVIEYSPKNIIITPNSTRYEVYGYLYIRKDDKTIIRQEEYFGNVGSLAKVDYPNISFSNGLPDVFTKKLTIYKTQNGLSYPSFIENITYQNTKEFEVSLLLINNIITSKKDFDRVKNRIAQNKEEYLEEGEFEYHADFWKNYNLLLLAPLNDKVKLDLEKEKPLEVQFAENGKKITKKKWWFWN